MGCIRVEITAVTMATWGFILIFCIFSHRLAFLFPVGFLWLNRCRWCRVLSSLHEEKAQYAGEVLLRMYFPIKTSNWIFVGNLFIMNVKCFIWTELYVWSSVILILFTVKYNLVNCGELWKNFHSRLYRCEEVSLYIFVLAACRTEWDLKRAWIKFGQRHSQKIQWCLQGTTWVEKKWVWDQRKQILQVDVKREEFWERWASYIKWKDNQTQW